MRLVPLVATGFVAVLLMGTAPAARAQDATPDPHHQGAAADAPAPLPAPGAASDADAGSSDKSAMMGGDMGMMQRMMACMMPGIPMPKGPMAVPGTAPASPEAGGEMAGPDGRMAMMRSMMGCMMPDRAGMMAGSGPLDPVTAAFEAINRRMHRDMMAGEVMSPDRAFASAMIAHHQGAIDMAKLVIAFGADPEIRKLAEGIIVAQQQEILQLRTWLARQPN